MNNTNQYLTEHNIKERKEGKERIKKNKEPQTEKMGRVEGRKKEKEKKE